MHCCRHIYAEAEAMYCAITLVNGIGWTMFCCLSATNPSGTVFLSKLLTTFGISNERVGAKKNWDCNFG